MIYFLIFIFALIYLLFNELEDESIKSNWEGERPFLNADISWRNKWKLNKVGNIIINETRHWYYFSFNPKYIERFYLSSTVLVFITDGEHLFQFIKNIAILAGFFVIGWQYGLAWFIGKSIGQIIKEKINWIN